MSENQKPASLIYEKAAMTVIANLRERFGVSSVEGKQKLLSTTGTVREIDALAWVEGSERFLVVEAKRHTTRGLNQDVMGSIAWKIQTLGAAGGIVATPLPFQKGAQLDAAAANIKHLLLSADSTPERYLAEYMVQRYVGFTFSDSLYLGVPKLVSGELRTVITDGPKSFGDLQALIAETKIDIEPFFKQLHHFAKRPPFKTKPSTFADFFFYCNGLAGGIRPGGENEQTIKRIFRFVEHMRERTPAADASTIAWESFPVMRA